MQTVPCFLLLISLHVLASQGKSYGTVPTSWIKHASQKIGRQHESPNLAATSQSSDPAKIVCYYPWRGSLTPDKVNTSYCTHLITGFATVGSDGKVDPGGDKDVYKQIAALKSKQPGLKVMLSVGGGGGEAGFSLAVSTPENREKLINSILDLLKECNLDGLDVDWEFPVWNSPFKNKDKPNFVQFLKEFHTVGTITSLLLSVAVAAPMPIVMAAYDVPGMARYVDFVNLMTYDFHSYKPLEDPFTGFNSPLFPRKVEKAYFSTLNLAWAAEYWVKLGMPREKVMVGIPIYAHTYQLANATMTWPDAPAVADNGDWAYYQVCDFIKGGAQTRFDSESLVPYAWKDLQWVSYENEQSVMEKAKWVKANGFGGVMTFDLNTDDWKKSCGDEEFPLHKTIHSVLTS